MTTISNGEAGSDVRTKLNAALAVTDLLDTPSANGAALVKAANYAAMRSLLSLGSLALITPTGTGDSSTYLRGDGAWATPGGGGTVTSVGGTGTVNGLTLTGTVTGSGNLTLGGTLAGIDLTSAVTGALPLANGGTGATTAAAARTALGVSATGADTTYAAKSANLSDLASVATARTNLGVSATGADTTYAARASNLSDLASASTARTNLGLGSIAVMPEATAAEYRAATAGKALSADKAWSAAAVVALTDAATIALDMSTFLNASVTLGGNRTLGNPTNPKVGQSGFIRVTQDGTGSRALAYASNWKYAGGSGSIPALSTAGGSVDVLGYLVLSSTEILITGIHKAVA